MQTIRAISISAGKAVQAWPTIFVMVLSMLKDFYEDRKRHKNDAEENNQITNVWNESTKSFEEMKWKDIKVGKIIQLQSDNLIPCDILLIKCSDPKGVCYVETKSLDGETNLKMKTVHKELVKHYQDVDLEKMK
jgi:phospholipid-transporting ATPase